MSQVSVRTRLCIDLSFKAGIGEDEKSVADLENLIRSITNTDRWLDAIPNAIETTAILPDKAPATISLDDVDVRAIAITDEENGTTRCFTGRGKRFIPGSPAEAERIFTISAIVDGKPSNQIKALASADIFEGILQYENGSMVCQRSVVAPSVVQAAAKFKDWFRNAVTSVITSRGGEDMSAEEQSKYVLHCNEYFEANLVITNVTYAGRIQIDTGDPVDGEAVLSPPPSAY